MLQNTAYLQVSDYIGSSYTLYILGRMVVLGGAEHLSGHKLQFYSQPTSPNITRTGEISQQVFIRTYWRSLECTFGGIRVLLLYLGVSPLPHNLGWTLST